MSVHYKFKSTLDFDTVSFDGLHISVADLKKAIFHQKRIGKNTDFDLQITNAQTKEDYTDENALIAKNTSLIVARVPLTVQQKRTWDRTEAPVFSNSKDESNLGRSVDLTRLDGSEEDKIRAMISQSTQDYDPSNYMKIRGANQTGEVPLNYRCYKCHQPGHWIKNCPLGVSQEPIEIKKSTGIPRSFMVPVDGPSVPGAMMTPGGTYAVPAIDHQAYKEGKKEKPPFAQDPEPIIEKPEIPEDLLCNICKDLLTDAVMIPCCGNSFCDECIRTFLLESEEHECPDCNEKDVSPESLIPNRYLRNAVLNFKNETGYAKRPTFKPTLSQKLAAPLLLSSEPSISEKLTASPTMSAATPAQAGGLSAAARGSSQAVTNAEAEAKEADKPIGKASPSYEKATTALVESALESDLHNDIVTKLVTDDETEVPPPPGTEPPLLPKRSADQSWHDRESGSESRDDEYRDRYSRERRRSFSRENHRDSRNASYHSRVESNMRPPNRRRSLSPRNSQHSEYPMHQSQAHGKNYQGHMSGDGRYHPPPMHYDPNLRRSTEDRAGTPTVDEPHLHAPSHGQPALLPYPPGEERVPSGYSAAPAPGPPGPPPPASHNPPLLPDPYMAPPRMPMYPPHQQPPAGHGYGPPPPPPPQRYDGRPPYQQQPGGYRPSQPPRSYSGGPPRPMRGMHNRYRSQIRSKWDSQVGYRGMQPPPPGMGRNMHNGTPGVIDDPLEAFQRMLREKDERDRRMGKHRSRRATRSRSRSRSYSRSRSRSFGRRASPSRPSRSRSPPPKRRGASRSPPPSHRARSRTPKKRRSRSGSFSISRSRSYSRSQSPRGSLPRERDRERKGKRPRDAPAPYRSPARSPPSSRYHKERDRDRERPRSREPYGSYYNDTAAPAPPVAPHDYPAVPAYREPRGPPESRAPPPLVLPRYASRGPPGPPPPTVPPASALLPPPPGLIVAAVGSQVPGAQQQQQQQLPPAPTSQQSSQAQQSQTAPAQLVAAQPLPPPTQSQAPLLPGHHLPPLDRKDYYDSYNRYPGAPPQQALRFNKRFDDVAPPGTEGYYDLPPPGIDHLERPGLSKDRGTSKDKDGERPHVGEHRGRRGERDRITNNKSREKDDRERREGRHNRDPREDDERMIYDKERYKDDRDRHRGEEKTRSRSDRERRERDYDYEKESSHRHYERHERHTADHKRSKRSTSPYSSKYRIDPKDLTPDRPRKKDKDHDDKSDDRKKEKKIKEKKKKKDSEEKEKKKKKKKEKKALIQKEAAAAVAAAAAAAAAAASVVSSSMTSTTTLLPLIKVKEEPRSGDEATPVSQTPDKPAPAVKQPSTPVVMHEEVVIKTEPPDDPPVSSEAVSKKEAISASMNPEPPSEPEITAGKVSPKSSSEAVAAKLATEPDSQAAVVGTVEVKAEPKVSTESLYDGLVDDTEITTTSLADVASKSEKKEKEEEAKTEVADQVPTESAAGAKEEGELDDDKSESATESTSPKKEEFLAPLPELSKWERDESAEKLDENSDVLIKEHNESEDNKSSTKIVTTEVLKRAENAIFQKAINAIRPIEIKKISDSRKVLYQNPEPKILEPEVDTRETRKSVNVTINVGKNERNVELSSEPLKKSSKLERAKFKALQLSPTRLSAKERLGDKIEDEAKQLATLKCVVDQRRDSATKAGDLVSRSRSPRLGSAKERRISLQTLQDSRLIDNTPIIPNPERKVFVEDRKRDRARLAEARQNETNRVRLIVPLSGKSVKEPMRTIHERTELRKTAVVDRITRTPPPPLVAYKVRSGGVVGAKDEDEEKDERVKRDKKSSREETKKRKKEHRSRSKSRDRKRRKDKKHKRERERTSDRRPKRLHSKEKELGSTTTSTTTTTSATTTTAGTTGSNKDKTDEDKDVSEVVPVTVETWKKQRRNPRLAPDRKRSLLDEASFEPDYSASDSESEDDRSTLIATKRAKVDDSSVTVDCDVKSSKKRPKPSSSEDEDSSSTDSSSTESDSSVESHRKKKKKHKKRKKRKASRKDSSSDSDVYTDSSDSSSEEEKHRKKKKSKSKSKQSKKKKKSKHK